MHPELSSPALRWHTHAIAVLLIAATAAISTTASAQSEPVTPSEAQAKLLREGVVAHKLGDHAKAIGIYQDALKVGELNTAYLGLARALLGAGRCDESSETLARVLTAPRAIDPPVAQILKDTAALRDQMATQCPASVTVVCTPPDLKVYIDGLGPLPCDGKPLILLPGEHVLRGEIGSMRVEETFKLGLMERAVIQLETEDDILSMAAPVDPPEIVPEEKPEVATDNRPPGMPKPKEEVASKVEEEPPPTRRVRKRAPAKPPERIKRWMLTAQLSGIVSGNADVDRETFETFDSLSGDETSGLMLEMSAGYRISRRYPVYFGAKLNIVPGYEINVTEASNPDEDEFSPTGTLADANIFGLVVFPVGAIELYGTVEAGLTFLSTPDIDGQTQGANFGAGGGLRYAFGENLILQAGLRVQGYSLVNDGDIFIDETVFDISGTRTLLTAGVAFMP